MNKVALLLAMRRFDSTAGQQLMGDIRDQSTSRFMRAVDPGNSCPCRTNIALTGPYLEQFPHCVLCCTIQGAGTRRGASFVQRLMIRIIFRKTSSEDSPAATRLDERTEKLVTRRYLSTFSIFIKARV